MYRFLNIALFCMVGCHAVEIRSIRPDEIKKVSLVYYNSWHATFDALAPYLKSQKTPEQCLVLWQGYYAAPDTVSLLVAIQNKSIVGVAYAKERKKSIGTDGKIAEIDKLYVAPSYQRHGIGKTLFTAVMQELRARGYSKVIVQLLTTNKNTNFFYEKMGGVLVAQPKVKHNQTMNVYEFAL